jgi:hypothetical protein
MIDLTVVVPISYQAERLPTILAHLEVQRYPAARFELAVIDGTPQALAEASTKRFASGAPMRTRYYRLEHVKPLATYNQVLREAAGQWVLFLSENLLAGADLLAQHVRRHEQEPTPVAVLGAVERHPQVLPGEDVVVPRPVFSPAPLRDLSFVDWRLYNLSLPRQVALDAGGFCEGFTFVRLADVELAYRLHHGGVRAVMENEAKAYAWASVPFDAQRREEYMRGYSLHDLLERVPDPDLHRRYAMRRIPFSAPFNRLRLPVYAWLRRLFLEDAHARALLRGGMLHCELERGYFDAAAARPPRVPAGF